MIRSTKEHYISKIVHIDYMLYRVGGSDITKMSKLYNKKYSQDELKEILCKKLLEFAEAPKYRNLMIKKYPTGKGKDITILPTYNYLQHKRYVVISRK